ncbi:hypothetical protein DPMN_149163 [Dreissena polymorpha]|uniref:Uncharacterized protein n=1 Tax=Dreissena polymorpha TaxID=45954 RepID=A0A9D4FB82_DREPO|nr:hypothetical protein DPMN_149163 [Dreissena polymorpha]
MIDVTIKARLHRKQRPGSIVYGTKKICAEFAAELASSPSHPLLSKTTGVITNHDVFVNIQDICGAAEQNNNPFTKGGFGTVSSINLPNGVCILRKRHPTIMNIYGVLATHVDLLMENAGSNPGLAT